MKREKVKPTDNGVWSAIGVAFSRIPFFELAYVTIIVIVIWRLPAILNSISKETLLLGIAVCLGLFILIGFCIWGLASRKEFYRWIYPEVVERSSAEKPKTNEEINKVARSEIKKAFRGSIK